MGKSAKRRSRVNKEKKKDKAKAKELGAAGRRREPSALEIALFSNNNNVDPALLANPPPPGVMDQFKTPMPRAVKAFLCRIEGLVEQCDGRLRGLSSNERMLTIYHERVTPALSLRDFFRILFQFARCSESCYVVAGLYINRLFRVFNERPILCSRSVQNILLTTVMVAAKLLDDNHNNLGFYAEIGGVAKDQLGRYEVALLQYLDCDLWVWPEHYYVCCNTLEDVVVS